MPEAIIHDATHVFMVMPYAGRDVEHHAAAAERAILGARPSLNARQVRVHLAHRLLPLMLGGAEALDAFTRVVSDDGETWAWVRKGRRWGGMGLRWWSPLRDQVTGRA